VEGTIVVVDHYRLIREALRAVLEQGGAEVVGEAGDGREAIAEARRSHPNVVVMEVAMPNLNGVDATRRIVAELPLVKVIGLGTNADRRLVIPMLDAGAAGYLLLSESSKELVDAVTVVRQGDTYVSPSVGACVVEEVVRRPRAPADRPTLREREVLQLVAEGNSSKEIATILQISVPTVETHRRQLMTKLQLRTIADLTKYAIREGLTSLDS
jgi:DNA-binding NarL/FixJ family response regulator